MRIAIPLAASLLICNVAFAQGDVLRFRFGPADAPPVEGFTLITEKDMYAPGKPGWSDTIPLATADRKGGSPLSRCFVHGYNHAKPEEGAGSFKLDLKDGACRVVLFCQDQKYARGETPFDVYANGEKKLSEVRVVGPVVESFTVTVKGGKLDIRFVPSSAPRRYNFWLVNAIVIAPEAEGEEAEMALMRAVTQAVSLKDFEEITPPPTPNPAPPTKQDTERGYQVWCHNYLDLVYPSTLPPADAPALKLKAFGCPGQTTCLAFSVHALKDLRAPQVKVTLNPLAEHVPQVRVDRVWVRPVREGSHGKKFTNRPDALLPLKKAKLSKLWVADYAVKEGESQTYWLTLSIPPDAAAGAYEAAVQFEPEGAPPSQVPLVVCVLPFRLADPPQYTGLYWYRSNMTYPQLVEKDLAGMYAHGARAVCANSPLKVTLEDGKLRVDCAALIQDLEAAKAAGLTGDVPWFNSFMTNGLGGKRADEPGYDDLYTQVVAEVEKQIGEHGLPRILWYPVDEPSNNPKCLAAARRWLTATKKVPGTLTYCTPNSIPAVRELADVMDVRCIQQLSLNAETAAETKQSGDTLYFYTSAYDGDRLPDRLRFVNGIFLFKSGAKALFYWHYQYPVGDPLNDLDGETCDYNLCHPSLEDPLNTLGWEGIREGNNDVAFLHNLVALIQEAQKGKAPAEAEAAQKWLDSVMDTFVLDGKLVKETYPKIPHDAYDKYRIAAVAHALKLLEKLGKLPSAVKEAGDRFRKEFAAE